MEVAEGPFAEDPFSEDPFAGGPFAEDRPSSLRGLAAGAQEPGFASWLLDIADASLPPVDVVDIAALRRCWSGVEGVVVEAGDGLAPIVLYTSGCSFPPHRHHPVEFS